MPCFPLRSVLCRNETRENVTFRASERLPGTWSTSRSLGYQHSLDPQLQCQCERRDQETPRLAEAHHQLLVHDQFAVLPSILDFDINKSVYTNERNATWRLLGTPVLSRRLSIVFFNFFG
jgi:hypothetical protein